MSVRTPARRYPASLRILSYVPIIFVLVATWELLAVVGACGGRWPHISAVGAAILYDSPQITVRVTATVASVVMSFSLGSIVGVPLGAYVSNSRFCVPGLYGLIAALRPVPVTILIPIFISFFGLWNFVVPLVALPIATNMAVNVAHAIRSSSSRRRSLLAIWGLNARQYARHVLLFECVDALLATGRILIPLALALNIALDYFLYTTEGIGAYVSAAYDRALFDRMFAGTIVVMALGALMSMTLDTTGHWSLSWKREM